MSWGLAFREGTEGISHAVELKCSYTGFPRSNHIRFIMNDSVKTKKKSKVFRMRYSLCVQFQNIFRVHISIIFDNR